VFNPLRRRPIWSLIFLAALILFVVLLWPSRRTVGRPGEPPFLTYFLVDGLTDSVFREELAAGSLPNIAKLIAQGTYVEHGIGAFPTMTGYAFYPFITGRDSTQSGVLGIRWFDRARKSGNFRNYVGRTQSLMMQDFCPEAPTIFEMLEGQHSFSINSYASRGALDRQVRGFDFSMAKYQDHYWMARTLAKLPLVGPWLLPDWFKAEENVMATAIADLANRPKVQWITFASPDGNHHLGGFAGRYVELLRHIDMLIGRYREESARLGQDDQRIYAILSDHGVSDVGANVDLRKPLAEIGIEAWRGEPTAYSTELTDKLEKWGTYDAVIAINGNLLNYLYLRPPGEPWKSIPEPALLRAWPSPNGPVDLLAMLARVEGVEMVVAREEGGGVEAVSRNGRGLSRSVGEGLVYECDGEDPLGYWQLGLCDGQIRDDATWLAQTYTTDYPDAVTRLYRLFLAAGVGDLVITAKAGYDLAADYETIVGNYRGGHGGLHAEQLKVPYVLAGPGVPKGKVVSAARAEDVGRALFRLMGFAQPSGGVDLLEPY
jgi:hypothetical protein